MLTLIIVTGVMFAAAGRLEAQLRYVVAGAALILLGLVEWLLVRLWRPAVACRANSP